MRFSSRQRLSERAERMVADRLLQRFLESKTMCARCLSTDEQRIDSPFP